MWAANKMNRMKDTDPSGGRGTRVTQKAKKVGEQTEEWWARGETRLQNRKVRRDCNRPTLIAPAIDT